MKHIISLSFLIAAAAAVPTITHAQSVQGGLTRSDVQTQLIALESVGYRPHVNDRHYPDEIQAAEARLAQPNAAHHAIVGSTPDASVAVKEATPFVPVKATTSDLLYLHH